MAKKSLNVELHLTPLSFGKTTLDNRALVVVDVLRSSTSICAALLAGAKGVIPTDGPGQAGEMRTKIGTDMSVLAGEKNGLKIEGFHLGNSPAEFTPESVGGKFIVMTTSNGTPVYGKSRNASPVIAGALVNISKVAERLAEDVDDVVIVCSGRESGFAIEDTICGGMLIHKLTTAHKRRADLNDAASLALLLYRSNKLALKETIEQGEHGKFLTSLNFTGDIEIATAVDSMPVVPVLRDGRLVLDAT